MELGALEFYFPRCRCLNPTHSDSDLMDAWHTVKVSGEWVGAKAGLSEDRGLLAAGHLHLDALDAVAAVGALSVAVPFERDDLLLGSGLPPKRG